MKILILPGDGIGPEITAVTRMALEALNCKFNLGLNFIERQIGMGAIKNGLKPIPDEVLEEVFETPFTILGPVSTMEYPPEAQNFASASLAIREGLDLFANIRPSKTRTGVSSMAKKMDLVIVRENTEGFYAARTMFEGKGEFMPTPDLAMSLRKISVHGSRRIAKVAFDLARVRRKKVTVVHKGNVLRLTDGLFLREVRSVAETYPEVEVDEIIVDAMAALLIREPERFDVVLTTNMFGDILSDEAAELSGGLGLGGSINTSNDHAVAQAAHGSAPDIAGKNMANPIAHILSAQMLLNWHAERDGNSKLAAAAKYLDATIDEVLADSSNHTVDIGGEKGTLELGEILVKAIER